MATSMEIVNALYQLLPRANWARGGSLEQIFTAISAEVVRFRTFVLQTLFTETNPATTTDFLEEWAEAVGVDPSNFVGITAAQVRDKIRAAIVARLTKTSKATPEQFQISLSTALDLPPEDIEIIEITADSDAAATDPKLVYRFYIFRDPALPGLPDIDAAQAAADDLAQGHTRPIVIESKAFRTDDPNSLTDRDLLGS